MFRGNHPARVDEKGRLKLPAEFKRQIDEQYGVQFYITSRDGKEAEIHPLPEWEKFEEKLAAVPSFNAAKKKLLKWLNYFGQQAEMDGQGRVLLPQILRERAKLAGDVIVWVRNAPEGREPRGVRARDAGSADDGKRRAGAGWIRTIRQWSVVSDQ